DVVVAEVTDEALGAGRKRVLASLDRGLRHHKLTEADRDETAERLRFTTDLTEFVDRDLVVEAAVEDEQVKADIFGQLDKIVERPDALLASNTSSIPIMKLGIATTRPEQVIGIHFFNPAPVMKLVELVPSLLSSAHTEARAEAFATEVLGKSVVRSPDRAGFVVNALLIPYLLSAIRMFESGFASAEDIDNGMVLGCAHPMGPLRLIDLIGLDTTKSVAESLYHEFKEPLYSPPPLLLRMVDAGLLGKKAGRGFYRWS
ncbi:MAG: 3-hydroxybutyryl-CoA dehydrogenase, partial [Pseudonocardiaceae bacterium]